MDDIEQKKREHKLNFSERLSIYIKRSVIFLLTLCLYGAAGYGIYALHNFSMNVIIVSVMVQKFLLINNISIVCRNCNF